MSALRMRPARPGDGLDAVWPALAERAGSVFHTRQWADAWMRHLGAGARLETRVAERADGSVAAVLPLVRTARPLRLLRFAGHGPADELGPVCAPAEREAALAALAEGLRRERGWDVLLADHLPGDLAAAGALGGRVLRREASPVVDLGTAGWDAYLASRSRNFREQVRRKERKLVRDHGIAFRLAGDPQRLPADLDALIALHEARWAGASQAFAGARRAFHHEFARVALEAGWLRLWLLEAEGRPVAAWLGYRFAGTEAFYQSGRDPAWDDRSVGAVLLHHTMRAAADDGIGTYRLLRGGEEYKGRYAGADAGVQSVAVARGPAGAAALAGAGAVLRVRRRARRAASLRRRG